MKERKKRGHCAEEDDAVVKDTNETGLKGLNGINKTWIVNTGQKRNDSR